MVEQSVISVLIRQQLKQFVESLGEYLLNAIVYFNNTFKKSA